MRLTRYFCVRESYLSIPMFIAKGFRVLRAGWKNVDATKALIQFSRLHAGPKLLGYMFTTWGRKQGHARRVSAAHRRLETPPERATSVLNVDI
jgi:hypothetical protein